MSPPEDELPNNLRAAVDKVMEQETLVRKPSTGSVPGMPATKQVLIRATDKDKDLWQRAAEHKGVSLSEFVRTACNEASSFLECQHPREYRRTYSWSDTCTLCGKRLK